MGISVNVNGVWRESRYPTVCVDGIWRKTDQLVSVNGVWRRSYDSYMSISPENIIGFRLIYLLEQKDLLSITEVVFNKEKDTNPKSLMLSVDSNKPILGSIKYSAKLYASIDDGSYIPVSDLTDSPIDNQLDGINISIVGSTSYQSTGGKLINGWNSLFTKMNNIPVYPNNSTSNDSNQISYSILPSYKRDKLFNNNAVIGIIRNANDVNGILEHHIESINVNGNPLPFTIELY